MQLFRPCAIVFSLLAPFHAMAQPLFTREVFLEQALKVLPVEERYDYHKALTQGPLHQPDRSVGAPSTESELAIAPTGWTLHLAPDAGPLAHYAADDLRDYLKVSMGVTLASAIGLENWPTSDKVLIAGTPQQLPGMGTELTASKDYEIRVDGARIIVCGFDDAGVQHGLFNLEARMRLREAPCLPRDLNVVRHSLYQSRMVLSWLGWMQWPDNFLDHLAHDGYDGIYASVYANPNGLPGPPHYDIIRKQDANRLNDVITRANAHGLKVYTPILYANTGEAENEAGLRDHVRDIVTKFPNIHGFILLTEGFYYKKFFGAGGQGDTDLEEWAQHWTRAVGIVAEECHRINPALEILPWEYNIDFRPHRVAIKEYVTRHLPLDTIPLLTWENGKQFQLGDLQGYLRDYSISQVGPAEVAAAQIKVAKERGMTVYCKVDCFATWQFGTIPYVPAPQQWQRRYDALAAHGVNGTLESWSNGYKPNFIAELRGWSSWTNPLTQDELLRGIARRNFGAGNEVAVLTAWEAFSEAIQHVPDTGPSMGTNSAVSHPLFFDEPPARMMTLNNSWWDEKEKSHWRHRLVAQWPYAHPIMVFYPDFTNKTNKAEQYARARSGVGQLESKERLAERSVLPIFNEYTLRAADALEAGLQPYRRAALNAPPAKQAAAMKEVLVVEQMQLMLRSLQAILQFEDCRFRLHHTDDPAEANALLDEMTALVESEIPRTRQALEITRRDSRLGYEAEMDYVYTPFVIKEKLEILEDTLARQLPAYRAGL